MRMQLRLYSRFQHLLIIRMRVGNANRSHVTVLVTEGGPGDLCGRAILNSFWVQWHKGLTGFHLCTLETRVLLNKRPQLKQSQFQRDANSDRNDRKPNRPGASGRLRSTYSTRPGSKPMSRRVVLSTPPPSPYSPLTQWNTLLMAFSCWEASSPPRNMRREHEWTIYTVRPAGQDSSTTWNRRGKTLKLLIKINRQPHHISNGETLFDSDQEENVSERDKVIGLLSNHNALCR